MKQKYSKPAVRVIIVESNALLINGSSGQEDPEPFDPTKPVNMTFNWEQEESGYAE